MFQLSFQKNGIRSGIEFTGKNKFPWAFIFCVFVSIMIMPVYPVGQIVGLTDINYSTDFRLYNISVKHSQNKKSPQKFIRELVWAI